MRRVISWWWTDRLLPALLLLAPLSAAVAGDDPFIDSVARHDGAMEALEMLGPGAPPAVRGASLSAAIVAAYHAEKHDIAAGLFRDARESTLTPDAIAIGLGALLVSSSSAAEIEPLKERLEALAAMDAVPGSTASALAAAGLARRAMIEDDLPRAIAHYDRARWLAERDLPPDSPVILRFAALHATHLRYIDPVGGDAAMEHVERAALHRLPEGHPLWIPVLAGMAEVTMGRGRHGEAAELYARISDIAMREWGARDPRLFSIMQYRAIALSGLGRYEEAVEVARLAIEAEGGANMQDRAMHRELIGSLLLGAGRATEARDAYRQALDMLAGVDRGDLRWAHIRSRLARVQAVLGEHAEALSLTDEALPPFREKLPETHPMRVLAEHIGAAVRAEAGHADEGYRALAPIIARGEERLLDIATGQADIRSFGLSNYNLFRDFVWIALRAGRLEEAWRSAQLATLGELAAVSTNLGYPGDAHGFSRAVERVRNERRNEQAVRSRLAGEDADATALAAAIAGREEAEAALDRHYGDYRDLLRPAPLSIADAQRELEPHEAIILPLSLGNRAVTLALTSEGLHWGETPHSWNMLQSLIERLRVSLDEGVVDQDGPDPFDQDAAHQLYRHFFPAAVRSAIAGKGRLIFPAGGPLARIPPSVLLTAPPGEGDDPPAYLIRDFAVAVRPDLRREAARDSGLRPGFAGIGDPRTGPRGDGPGRPDAGTEITALRSLPPLPGAARELALLRDALGGDALLLTGAQATERAVRRAPLDEYAVIAFATHGLVGGQLDGLDEPALVLTPGENGGAEDDGLLLASEIADLNLPADWIILSACNTAAGQGRGKPTYGGLARAFRLAGARSLLLSHWPLRDDAAAYLTVATMRGFEAGQDRAEALRRAQLSLLDGGLPQGHRPAVWAPFMMIEN